MQKISIKVYVITYAKSFEHLNSLGYLYYKLFFFQNSLLRLFLSIVGNFVQIMLQYDLGEVSIDIWTSVKFETLLR